MKNKDLLCIWCMCEMTNDFKESIFFSSFMYMHVYFKTGHWHHQKCLQSGKRNTDRQRQGQREGILPHNNTVELYAKLYLSLCLAVLDLEQ